MFITMIWILALVSAFMELYVAFKIPAYLKITEKFPLLALVASLMLSFALGTMFGAHGLIALMGGLLSTMMTLGCYRVLAKWHDGTIPRKLDKYKRDWESFTQLMKDLWKVIHFIIRVITFPVWAYRDIKTWFARQKLRFARS